MFLDLVKETRSVRRFLNERKIQEDTLVNLINLARLTPSGANKQPLKYMTVNTQEVCDKVFATLAWAGYIKDWDGPVKEEQPVSYILMLRDSNIQKPLSFDDGIAAQTILLGARELGIGGCFIGNIKRTELRDILQIPEQYEISLVIALGYPKEEIKLHEIEDGQSIEYFRDNNQIHHVPKRKLEDIILDKK